MLIYKRGPMLMLDGVWGDGPGASAAGAASMHGDAEKYLLEQAAVHGARRHLEYHYKSVPMLLPQEEIRTCYALAAAFAKACGCPQPAVETFREADAWEKDTFSRAEPINGLYRAGETLNGMPLIHIRARRHGEMLGTIAHEVKHAEQHDAGRRAELTGDESEAEAEAFGADMVAAFDLPPHARLWTAKRWEDRPPGDASHVEMFDYWWNPGSGALYQNIARRRTDWAPRRVVRL